MHSTLGAEQTKNFETQNLVAWCVAHRWDAKDRSPEERAQLLKELGIGRVAYNWRAMDKPDFEEEIRQYKKHGLEFFAFWNEHEEAFRLFKQYGLTPQIWKTNPSPKAPSQEERIAAAAKQMYPFAKRAHEIGSSFGLYNHGNWGGQAENLVAVCKALHQAGLDNVGIVYNFHHAHDTVADFEDDLALMMPYLLCLNLNGMADAETVNPKDLTTKIKPVGAGKHETAMLKSVVKLGYSGPIGILGHLPANDVAKSLRDNLAGLTKLFPDLEN